jgi:hypothetical protein
MWRETCIWAKEKRDGVNVQTKVEELYKKLGQVLEEKVNLFCSIQAQDTKMYECKVILEEAIVKQAQFQPQLGEVEVVMGEVQGHTGVDK